MVRLLLAGAAAFMLTGCTTTDTPASLLFFSVAQSNCENETRTRACRERVERQQAEWRRERDAERRAEQRQREVERTQRCLPVDPCQR